MAQNTEVPGFPSLAVGEKLFSSDGEPSELAVVQSGGFSRYAIAYKLAADVLVREGLADSNEQCDLETMSGPILFLYRHFLELSLKSLAEQSGATVQEIGKRGHDLKKLWELVKGSLPPQSQDEEIDAFSQLINEWVELDKRADAFRFPTNLSGARHSPFPFPLNIARVREKMDQVYTLVLDLGMYLDQKRKRSEG